MPNWCHDTLTVQGEAKELARFVAEVQEPIDEAYLRAGYEEVIFADGKPPFEEYLEMRKQTRAPLSFEAFVPTPAELLSGEGWYMWRLANWGTKWDAKFDGGLGAIGAETMDVEASMERLGREVRETEVEYRFTTAWSPPIPWLEQASIRFPELRFELVWAEVGSEAAAREVFVGGVLADHEDLEVENVLAPEEMWF